MNKKVLLLLIVALFAVSVNADEEEASSTGKG